MLAFGIRYLNGFVAASEPHSHDRPEWPPHPGRVFMAPAAAYFDTGADAAERAALKWVEELETSTGIQAGEPSARALVTHYVPVNDKVGPAKAILQSAPR
jgi:CRISPR-associated protein Csb2